MDSSSIYVSSKTALGNLENFLESARGKTVVIEDKYRKSTGSIRFGVRKDDCPMPGQARERAATRQALYQAIAAVLESNKRIAALSHLQAHVQPPANCDALFIPDTTQLKPEVLDMLFRNDAVSQASQPAYRSAIPSRPIDRTLAPADYLSLPSALGSVPTLKDIANNARNGKIERALNNAQLSSLFVKDFERTAASGAYRLEHPDGSQGACHTLAEFVAFVGPGDQHGFKNGANLVTVVSYLTSQNLPVFLNAAILKSPHTPVRSGTGEPLFFKANLKGTYDLKKMANGDIVLTYKGVCRPDEIRKSPAHDATPIALPKPGLVAIECDVIFKPDGDIDHGNVRIHAEGLTP